jgi:hypothetical protein
MPAMTANTSEHARVRARWTSFLRPLATGLLCLAAPACVSATGDSRVFLTSDPPGAEVALDGQDTGLTTPTILDLGALVPSDHQVTISKEGYDRETRTVIHHKILYTSAWQDGVVGPEVPPFPLWFTFGDFFAPFGVHWQYEPHELHVKLYRKGEFVETVAPIEERGPPGSR